MPPIVPLIFYHGRTRWSGALSVAEMIAGEGELAAFARRLCCVLHDLGERPLAELSGDPAVWSGLAALVAAFRGQPEEGVLRRILSGVPDGSELELQRVEPKARPRRCFVFCGGDSIPFRRVLGRGLRPGQWRSSMPGLMPCLTRKA